LHKLILERFAIEVIRGSLLSEIASCGVLEVVGVGAGEELGELAGEADLVATPLLQTVFLPDLIQVNSFPADSFFCPNLVHEEPGLTGDAARAGRTDKGRRINSPSAIFFTH